MNEFFVDRSQSLFYFVSQESHSQAGSTTDKSKSHCNDRLSRSFRKNPLVPVHCTACDSPSQSTHCHDGVSGENAFIDILVRNISDGQKRHLTT